MPTVRGRISRIATHEEDGRTDCPLALSKIIWTLICILFPFSFFRLLNDLFGPLVGAGGILALLILIRLMGPFNLVMLDELLSRIFPALRTVCRTGRVRVYNIRIEPATGEQISCILRGELIGTAPLRGDSVIVNGAYRCGTLWVKSGRNEVTGALIAPRPGYSGWVLMVTLGLFLFFCLYLNGALDQWLDPWLVDWVDYLHTAFSM